MDEQKEPEKLTVSQMEENNRKQWMNLVSKNRHERRALGKINGVKIPGINTPIKNEKDRSKVEHNS